MKIFFFLLIYILFFITLFLFISLHIQEQMFKVVATILSFSEEEALQVIEKKRWKITVDFLSTPSSFPTPLNSPAPLKNSREIVKMQKQSSKEAELNRPSPLSQSLFSGGS